jgi:S1-C subfamily serine protease
VALTIPLFAAVGAGAQAQDKEPSQPPAASQRLSIDELVSGVVKVKTIINPDGRTVGILGREREGSGVVLDHQGLVVTIGYLMVEAHAAEVVTNDGRALPAEVVGYDYETGFGLLRTLQPLKVRPLALGRSADVKPGDRVIVAAGGGPDMAGAALVAAKREFAGYWEYLLDEALFTTPPHPAWSGAALINREGKLLGIGSLVVMDASGRGEGMPGNMFVPIDRLTPIMGELIEQGRVSGRAKPWLGLNTDEVDGALVVRRVTAGSPAEKAGLKPGDVIQGVDGERVSKLAEFYRKVWARGGAGVLVPLDIKQGEGSRRLEVQSINRMEHLRLKSTF